MPSRSARKRASDELQALGEQVAALPAGTIASLPLPERFADALAEAKRLKSFGARRRQAQYLGKLMRRLDPDALVAVRAAVSRRRTRRRRSRPRCLHRAERIRDRVARERHGGRPLARGDAGALPSTDAVAAARADPRGPQGRDAHATLPGEAPRRGRAYREIFAIVRARLERV